MSYGTRKAIAGGIKASYFAHEGAKLAIAKFNACHTLEEINAVLAWAKERGGWLFRTSADDRLISEALEKAHVRAALERGCSK